MGSCHTKYSRFPRDEAFEHKVTILREEEDQIMCMRDAEIQAYKREMMVSVFKEAEWRKERRRLRGEVERLRKRLEDREGEKRKGVENETVEKWKQLYFDIKNELDDLIHRTSQDGFAGEELCWKAEAKELVKELQKEVMAKEKTIELQQSQIASMKQEENRREIEIDILRQSLKIVFHGNKGSNKNE